MSDTRELSRMIDYKGQAVYLDSSKIVVLQQLPEEEGQTGDISRAVLDGGTAVDLFGTPDEIWGFTPEDLTETSEVSDT